MACDRTKSDSKSDILAGVFFLLSPGGTDGRTYEEGERGENRGRRGPERDRKE